jgi:hypothetical protein
MIGLTAAPSIGVADEWRAILFKGGGAALVILLAEDAPHGGEHLRVCGR